MVFSKDGENTIEDECKVFFAVLNFFLSAGGQQGGGEKKGTRTSLERKYLNAFSSFPSPITGPPPVTVSCPAPAPPSIL